MLVPGMEEELINYTKDKTICVDEHYADKIEQLTPGTRMKYYIRNKDDIFNKEHGSTLFKPTGNSGKHVYRYGAGSSFKIQDDTQRFSSYETELLDKPLKKPVQKQQNKKTNKLVLVFGRNYCCPNDRKMHLFFYIQLSNTLR